MQDFLVLVKSKARHVFSVSQRRVVGYDVSTRKFVRVSAQARHTALKQVKKGITGELNRLLSLIFSGAYCVLN